MLSRFTFTDGNLFQVRFDFEGRVAVKLTVMYALQGLNVGLTSINVNMFYRHWLTLYSEKPYLQKRGLKTHIYKCKLKPIFWKNMWLFVRYPDTF